MPQPTLPHLNRVEAREFADRHGLNNSSTFTTAVEKGALFAVIQTTPNGEHQLIVGRDGCPNPLILDPNPFGKFNCGTNQGKLAISSDGKYVTCYDTKSSRIDVYEIRSALNANGNNELEKVSHTSLEFVTKLKSSEPASFSGNIEIPHEVKSIVPFPDGSKALVITSSGRRGGRRDSAYIIDLAKASTGQPDEYCLRSYELKHPPLHTVISPDGKFAAFLFGTFYGELHRTRAWQVETDLSAVSSPFIVLTSLNPEPGLRPESKESKAVKTRRIEKKWVASADDKKHPYAAVRMYNQSFDRTFPKVLCQGQYGDPVQGIEWGSSGIKIKLWGISKTVDYVLKFKSKK